MSKIKEAKGGVLYVNEAHQLAARMMRGQNDYSDVAVGELMQAMCGYVGDPVRDGRNVAQRPARVPDRCDASATAPGHPVVVRKMSV